jgi:hypothetical protein
LQEKVTWGGFDESREFADGRGIGETRICIDLCGTFGANGIDAPRRVQQTWERLPAVGNQQRSLFMNTYPPPGPGAGGVGRRIEEAVELIELELRHTIAYVNDAVIPQVRRESISAMRTVAETLRNLADRIDQSHNPPPNQPKDPRS